MTEPLQVEKLQRADVVEQFTCGDSALDRFLACFALPAQQANSSQTYVGVRGSTIVGFYTLVVGEVRDADAPMRIGKAMPRHPIPLMVLARLAVHTQWQRRGIGAGLPLDALGRTLQVADIAGLRALAVQAKDEPAVAFYRHFGFVPSDTDPRHLFMLVNDIRRAASPTGNT